MADQTTSSITIDASPAEVMAVIADFEAYPEWTGAVKEVEVLETQPDGRASLVRYRLDAGVIKDEYTLAYTWNDDVEVRWNLAGQGNVLTAMNGAYLLADNHDGTTHVTYELAVDLRMPMIGMMKRKAAKLIIDTALKELKKRVEG
jgi:ribosome-associated toxin RatA of RatAB toxin-antitoxin module